MAKLKWDPVPEMLGWNKIKSLRSERGLSQAELAVGAGVAVTTVYFLELGYEKRTTNQVKKKMAKFFDVDIEDIFPAEMLGNRPAKERFLKVAEGQGRPVFKAHKD